MRVRIIRPAGNYVPDAEFDVDDQVAGQLIADGIAELVKAPKMIVEEPPARVTSEVKTKKGK